MRLILASASPRRAQILRDAGIPFMAAPANVEESRQPQEPPGEFVQRLAESKARFTAVRLRFEPSPVIIVGADTEVVVDGAVLGKPVSAEAARDMLRRLSGRTHAVITGLAVIRLPEGAARIGHETTWVTLAPLSEPEMGDYVASGEPLGKAGAYAIQGRAGRFVTRVEGCYFNVVGLPLARLYSVLRDFGWPGGSGKTKP